MNLETRSLNKMKPTACFLLAFYLISLFTGPAELLNLENHISDNFRISESYSSLIESTYTLPAHSSQSSVEVKNIFSLASLPALSAFAFSSNIILAAVQLKAGVFTLIKSLDQWPKICINAP